MAQQVKKIYCFREYIIICCERSIRTIKVDIDNHCISYVLAMSKEYDGTIIDCCMSKVMVEADSSGKADEENSREEQSDK